MRSISRRSVCVSDTSPTLRRAVGMAVVRHLQILPVWGCCFAQRPLASPRLGEGRVRIWTGVAGLRASGTALAVLRCGRPCRAVVRMRKGNLGAKPRGSPHWARLRREAVEPRRGWVAGIEEMARDTPLLITRRKGAVCADGCRRPPRDGRGPLRCRQEGGDPKVPAHGQPAKADISAAADCRLMPVLVGCGAS